MRQSSTEGGGMREDLRSLRKRRPGEGALGTMEKGLGKSILSHGGVGVGGLRYNWDDSTHL